MKRSLTHRARKWIFWIHLWVGLILGGWFTLMGLTGSVLAWKEEGIVWELQRRSGMAAQGTLLPPSRALEAVKKAYPKMPPMELATVVPPNRSFPTYVFIQPDLKNQNETKIILVDPYTAKVTPAFRIRDTVIGFCEFLHTNLLLAAKGTIANGVLALFGALLLASGIWLWWPSTLRQLKSRLGVKRGVSYKRLLYDLHNVLGVYLFPLLMLLTLTAAVMVAEGSFDHPIEKLADNLMNTPPKAPPPTVKPAGRPLSVDRLTELARTAVPGSEITYLMLPSKPEAVFTAYFNRSDGKGLFPESILSLDPYTGKVMRMEKDAEAAFPHRLMAMNESLHYGVWGGKLSKLLYTLAGFMPLGLLITGVLKWWNKRKNVRKRASNEAALESENEFRSFEEPETERILR